MRPITQLRLLLLPAALLLAACDDPDSPFEPAESPVPAQAPALDEAPALAAQRWADAYLKTVDPAASSFTPSPYESYNRGGGSIKVTRPPGSTGRYIVTFGGLSNVLGTKSTVHVSGYGLDNTYCKPMNGMVVSDRIEVRCFEPTAGAPANGAFTIVVLRKAAGRAFAFAHQPTSASYTPNGKGSYNPGGSTRVTRFGPGLYQVTFNGLASHLQGRGGLVQVNAVASGKAYCKALEYWGGSPNVSVAVQCYTTTPVGTPVDARFSVLFQLPAAHLAYAYADQPSVALYPPNAFYSSHPASRQMRVERRSTGVVSVYWYDVDPEIIDAGNWHVTAIGENDYAHCKVGDVSVSGMTIRCFAPNGTPVNTLFSVLLGS
jgi:hypothetical protein